MAGNHSMNASGGWSFASGYPLGRRRVIDPVTRLKMLTKHRLLIFAGLAIVLIAIVWVIAMPELNRRIIREHQQNVIREFNGWTDEYSTIADRDTAIRAAGMIEYISTYYLPSDGYRSDLETEQRLEDARQRSMTQIADALSAYTGTVMSDPLDWPAEMCDNTQQILDGG